MDSSGSGGTPRRRGVDAGRVRELADAPRVVVAGHLVDAAIWFLPLRPCACGFAGRFRVADGGLA